MATSGRRANQALEESGTWERFWDLECRMRRCSPGRMRTWRTSSCYACAELNCLPSGMPPIPDATTNVWGEPVDKVVPVQGRRAAASHIVQNLLLRDFDVAYAFKPHHHPTLAHAFMNTRVYLD